MRTKDLTDALADFLDTYPEEYQTILRGFAIVIRGKIALLGNGLYRVSSDSPPGKYYRCGDWCTCRAVNTAINGRCQHRFAVLLVQKASGAFGENQKITPITGGLVGELRQAMKDVMHGNSMDHI